MLGKSFPIEALSKQHSAVSFFTNKFVPAVTMVSVQVLALIAER